MDPNKCLTFCLENHTSNTVLFGIKGMHVVWMEEPVVANRYKEKAKKDIHMQKTDVFVPYSEGGKQRRFLCAGDEAWENLCRYELEPRGHVLGKFKRHRYNDEFILVLEFLVGKEVAEQESFLPTQTAVGQNESPSPIKRMKIHKLNVSMNDMNTFEDESADTDNEISIDHPPRKTNSVYRSFRIRHMHEHDVILGINVSKSLYPFTNSTRYSLDPFTYRFMSYHDVGNSGIQLNLAKNIPKNEVISIAHEYWKKETPKRTKKSNQLPSCQDISLCLYDDDFLDIHRESILFYLSILLEAKEKINAVVIKDTLNAFDPVDYIMKNVIRSNSKEKLTSWFRSKINTNTFIQSQMSKLHFKPYFHCRSVQILDSKLRNTKYGDYHDCIIVIKSIKSTLNPSLKLQLRQLEGFPILFMLYDLDKCQDIYEALKKKESAEKELLKIFSASHKPFIVSCSQKRTEMDNFIVCKFLREALDIIVERIVASSNIENISNIFDQVIMNHQEGEESPSKTTANGREVYFFGVDNEHQSVNAGIQEFKFPMIEAIPCIHSREQFQSISTLFSAGIERSKIAMKLSSLSRGMSNLLNLSESSDDEESSVHSKDSIRKVKSQSGLSSLVEKASGIHFRTKSAETIQTDLFTNDSFTEFHKQFEKKIMETNLQSIQENEIDTTPIVSDLGDDEQSSPSAFVQQSEKIFILSESMKETSIVVLCVELSGRVLITGKNGTFTSFIEEIQKRTKHTILFIDRLDCSADKSQCKFSASNKGGVFGDPQDLELDEELQQTQNIQQFFKYRYYHHPNTTIDINERNLFWNNVISEIVT